MAPVPSSAQPHAGILAQRTVEYRIAGAVDGLTVPDGTVTIDEENVFVVSVADDAGIFDPTRFIGGNAALGNRYIEWIEVILDGGVIPLGSRISIVDDNNLVPSVGSILELRRIADIGGQPRFYSSLPFTVYQCTAIAVRGIPPASSDRPTRVLFGLRQPTTPYEEAALAQAWCSCFPSIAQGGGGTPAEAVSLQVYSFSSSNLATIPGGTQDFFGGISAYLDVPTYASVTFNNSLTGSLIPLGRVAAVNPATTRLTIRPGTVTGFVIRVFNTGGVPIPSVEPFVEVAVGGGAFVHTALAAPQLVPPNTNFAFAVNPVAFPVNARLRFGFTTDTLTDITFDAMIDVEITTPS